MKDISPCSEAYPQSVNLITPSNSLIDISWIINKKSTASKIKCSLKLRKESETILTLFPINYEIEEKDKKDGRFECGFIKNKEFLIQK